MHTRDSMRPTLRKFVCGRSRIVWPMEMRLVSRFRSEDLCHRLEFLYRSWQLRFQSPLFWSQSFELAYDVGWALPAPFGRLALVGLILGGCKTSGQRWSLRVRLSGPAIGLGGLGSFEVGHFEVENAALVIVSRRCLEALTAT